MSDEWKSFVSAGQAFAAHDTVRHCDREYARGPVHTNSVEGFNDRIRRTVAGVFHHISPQLADLYFNEIGFRCSQRIITGQVTRAGHEKDGRSSNRAGRGSTQLCSYPPYSDLPSVDSSAGPSMVASRSAVPSLSLVDKGAAR